MRLMLSLIKGGEERKPVMEGRQLIVLLTLASANDVILWFGENPCKALLSELFPPERAPSGSAPVGVRPFNCRTDSDSSLGIGEGKSDTGICFFPVLRFYSP